jgi:hypothetical protein
VLDDVERAHDVEAAVAEGERERRGADPLTGTQAARVEVHRDVR